MIASGEAFHSLVKFNFFTKLSSSFRRLYHPSERTLDARVSQVTHACMRPLLWAGWPLVSPDVNVLEHIDRVDGVAVASFTAYDDVYLIIGQTQSMSKAAVRVCTPIDSASSLDMRLQIVTSPPLSPHTRTG